MRKCGLPSFGPLDLYPSSTPYGNLFDCDFKLCQIECICYTTDKASFQVSDLRLRLFKSVSLAGPAEPLIDPFRYPLIRHSIRTSLRCRNRMPIEAHLEGHLALSLLQVCTCRTMNKYALSETQWRQFETPK